MGLEAREQGRAGLLAVSQLHSDVRSPSPWAQVMSILHGAMRHNLGTEMRGGGGGEARPCCGEREPRRLGRWGRREPRDFENLRLCAEVMLCALQ